jgi:hypothetical protein
MREKEGPKFENAPEARARVRVEPLRALPINAMLGLQRSVGNQAVVRALARAKDAETATATDGAAKFKRAVKAGDWLAAAMSLWELDDDEVRHLLDPLSDAELDALEAAATSSDLISRKFPGLAETVHRHVSFQKHAPDQSRLGWRGIVTDRGTLEHEGEVDGGGTVKVRKGTDFRSFDGQEFEDGFSLKFKGKGAAQSSWLQFIWREVEVDDPARGHFMADGVCKTPTGMPYRLTTDHAELHYNVDSADPANPFYEAEHVNNRSFESTTMFDAPNAAEEFVRREFDLGATRVVSRAHFTTYLVRDMDVLYAVSIDVEWEYRRPEVVAHKDQQVTGAQNVAALDGVMRERLVLQYPAIDYLP